jgi:hypothetical protein
MIDTIFIAKRKGDVNSSILYDDSIKGLTTLVDTNEDGDTPESFYYYYDNHKLLSIIGPYLSFETEYDGSGGAHPVYGTIYKTINFAKDKTTQWSELDFQDGLLTDIFNDKDIYRALMKDQLITNHLKKKKPKDLADLLANLRGGCEMDLTHLLNSFRIVNIDRNIALIDFGFTHGCEADRGKFSGTAIGLPVLKKNKFMFEKAINDSTLGIYFSGND